MQTASTVVAFVASGEPFDALKQLVHQACQHQCLMPVLPLEYQNVHYRLQQPASEGETKLCRVIVQAPARLNRVEYCVADASPDGDALQGFEWASNPPGV